MLDDSFAVRPWLRTGVEQLRSGCFYAVANDENHDKDQDFSVFQCWQFRRTMYSVLIKNTHYVPHTAPFSIIEVNGAGLGHTGLYRTRI